jgi:hypothetical protein
MTNAIVDTILIMSLTTGGVALAYVGYALLWLPVYLLGGRHPEGNPKEM